MIAKRTLRGCFGVIVFLALSLFLFLPRVSAITPSGAQTEPGIPETAPADPADHENAYAGNVTSVDITGYTTTQSWQGFFGNVSGVIELTDINNNTMYNWTLASPQGEVYASTNETGIMWTHIQCFNFTATGTYDGNEWGNGGLTNQNGTNITQLEDRYGIKWDDVDGVNETFFENNGHDEFYTANKQFITSECLSTMVYGPNGPTANLFEEVLLYEPVSSSIIFASLLEENDPAGFDDANHDFEMLVLENGHGTDVDSTDYYFYVELE